jgi:ribosome-associated protein
MPRTTTTTNAQKKSLAFAIDAANLLHDRHCEDVLLLDVRGLSQVCDHVLIGTGTSDRQMKSVAGELEDLGEEHEEPVYRTSRDEGGTWIVIDFVDLVVHLFEPNQRAYYDLESMWSDAGTVNWHRPRKKSDVRADEPKKAPRRRRSAN